MDKIEFKCPNCGKTLCCSPEQAGAKGRCVSCGAEVVAPAAPVEKSPDFPRTSFSKLEPLNAPPSASPPSAYSSKPETLPEKMRANRLVAGRTCGHCNKIIALGDPVVNCPVCNASMHQACFDQFRCCPTPLCKGFEAPTPTPSYSTPSQTPAGFPAQQNLAPWDKPPYSQTQGFQEPGVPQRFPSPDQKFGETEPLYSHQMRPCPYCGEMIQRIAKKCRFCNEFLDDSLRKQQAAKISSPDDNLTTGDWIFCVLCSGIACIFGIVYAIQGKKKGLKMVGVSLLVSLIWSLIRIAIENS
ncbi:hypothetical protein JW926_07815 [Candidatus Sumerlaeota bacterium]|nr:hypothetical protein [Candidatus Sumerlaeota bacterium]